MAGPLYDGIRLSSRRVRGQRLEVPPRMGILTWIILGLIAGVIANFAVGGGYGLIGSIILGIVGAVVGGFVASALGFGDVTGLDVRSIVIAIVGACIVLFAVRAMRGTRATAV